MYIIKKDGTRDPFNVNKVVSAVNKSAERVLYQFSKEKLDFICRFVTENARRLAATACTSCRCTTSSRALWTPSARP